MAEKNKESDDNHKNKTGQPDLESDAVLNEQAEPQEHVTASECVAQQEQGEQDAGKKSYVKWLGVHWERFTANFGHMIKCINGRAHHAQTTVVPIASWQRPKDFLVYFVWLIPFALVFLDPVSVPFSRQLPPVIYQLFDFLTDFGTSGWILVPSGLLCLFLLACSFKGVGLRRRYIVARSFMVSAYLFMSVALSGLTVIVLKWNFGRARPRHFDELGPVAFDSFAWVSSYTSFPSGHATTTGALFVALMLLWPRLRWVWAGLGFWIGFSRVIVGAHYPSDVIAGLMLGAAFSIYLARWMGKRHFLFRLTGKGVIRSTLQNK
ncbi:phosphatase PAP2 family protein [Polycladidibacter stylochi]|uniref:phosphatase PAP2 family protein n=1 Tax=Polycladidibacter stylochi TaxID=1807766 RepID=UPI00082CD861|nr:phosphatase PAP2 family protein [Pseudovibrio stylochi]